jgi:hypothetical protein
MPIIQDEPPDANAERESRLAYWLEMYYRDREWTRKPREANTLDEQRSEMVENRKHAIGKHDEIYFDGGPTGAGKSFADGEVLKHPDHRGLRSLALLPNHQQCREAVRMMAELGSTAFPELNDDTCLRFDEAREVIEVGLPITKTLCPDCPHRDDCDYRPQLEAATEAQHSVATLMRGTVSMPTLTEGRNYIAVHEQPLDMLRPTHVAKHKLGFKIVRLIAETAEEGAADPNARGFYRILARIAGHLHNELNGGNENARLELPKPAPFIPHRLHADMHAAIRKLGAKPPPDSMQLALAAAEGNLHSLTFTIDELPKKDGVRLLRTLIGVTRTPLPHDATIIFNDATGDKAELEAVTGRKIRIITPQGVLERKHPVLQIIPTTPMGDRDVTLGREVGPVADLLRAILNDLPQFEKVGLLTHKKFLAPEPDGDGVIRDLRSELGDMASRLVMTSHFHGGFSRGSNEWVGKCDVLVVLGTPRVPPHAIKHRLLQLDKHKAACVGKEGAGWSKVWWIGKTELGSERTVQTGRYAHLDWDAAYRSIVRSELKQAIGRGRGILPQGMPVFVVTTEDLGDGSIRLADGLFMPLTTSHAKVLGVLRAALAIYTGPYKASPLGAYIDGSPPAQVTLSTAKIAPAAGISVPRANVILRRLETDGRVGRVGEKGGWFCVEPGSFKEPYTETVRTSPTVGRRKRLVRVGPYLIDDTGVEPWDIYLPWECRQGTGESKSQRRRRQAKERQRERDRKG